MVPRQVFGAGSRGDRWRGWQERSSEHIAPLCLRLYFVLQHYCLSPTRPEVEPPSFSQSTVVFVQMQRLFWAPWIFSVVYTSLKLIMYVLVINKGVLSFDQIKNGDGWWCRWLSWPQANIIFAREWYFKGTEWLKVHLQPGLVSEFSSNNRNAKNPCFYHWALSKDHLPELMSC